MWKSSARRTVPLVLMMVSPIPVWAMCCAGDANVIKAADSGLGQSQPLATNLSLDPRWRVHAFERDAITYFQISDTTDGLQFIIGKSGNVFWVLPAGPTETRVVLPSDDRAPGPLVDAEEVYRHPDFRLLVRGTGQAASWWVENRPAMP